MLNIKTSANFYDNIMESYQADLSTVSYFIRLTAKFRNS